MRSCFLISCIEMTASGRHTVQLGYQKCVTWLYFLHVVFALECYRQLISANVVSGLRRERLAAAYSSESST